MGSLGAPRASYGCLPPDMTGTSDRRRRRRRPILTAAQHDRESSCRYDSLRLRKTRDRETNAPLRMGRLVQLEVYGTALSGLPRLLIEP